MESNQYASDIEAIDEPLGEIPDRTTMEKLTTIFSTAAVLSAIASMIISGSTLVFVAGGLSMLVAPYAVYQQRQLTDIEALQVTHDRMKDEVNQLHGENDRLKHNVTELEGTVASLKDVEDALDLLTRTQDQNVQKLKDQVAESYKILQSMEKNLRTSVLQNLMTVIIRCDTDSDFTIDIDEIDNLLLKLKQINGLHINEQKFRDIVAEAGGKVDAIMLMIKDVLERDESIIALHERIFQFENTD